MNTKIKTILGGALLAAGVLFALPAHAQENGGSDKKPRPERSEGGGPRGDQLARLKESLGLTDEQVEKLKPIFAARQKEIQELNKEAGPDADRAARREKMQAIREKYKPQIAAILTAEQNEKLAKIEQQRRQGGPGGGEGRKGKGGEGDGAGAPPPPPPAE